MEENRVEDQEMNPEDEQTITESDQNSKTEESSEMESNLNNEAQVAELKDKYLRLMAEFDNYRRRTAKENLEIRKHAAADTITALLPVLDDFDRAKKIAEQPDSSEVFSEGIALVYHKLYQILQQMGVRKMESDGVDFDTELHEAITEIPAGSEAMKGKVVDTISSGYYLHDKIIRYAKVVVGK